MRHILYERYYGSKHKFLIIPENLKINKISIDQKRPSWPGKNGEIGVIGEFPEFQDNFVQNSYTQSVAQNPSYFSLYEFY